MTATWMLWDALDAFGGVGMHWDEFQVSQTSQLAKRAVNMKDRNENDAWVWDVFQQQDARRKARSSTCNEIKRCAPEVVTPVRLPGGCLLYQLNPGKPPCVS